MNIIKDSDFDYLLDFNRNFGNVRSLDHYDDGWFVPQNNKWNKNQNGLAFVDQDGAGGLIQVIKNDNNLTGIQTISFDATNVGTNNTLILQVYGVNGDFKLSNWNLSDPISTTEQPIVSQLILDTGNIADQEFIDKTFSQQVDFGSGFEYIAVRFFADGVDYSEQITIDNVFIGTPAIIPTLTVTDVVVNEDEGIATLTVNLSEATTLDVTVEYSTSNNTAIEGVDYLGVSNNTLTIPAGSTQGSITVNIVNDTISESDESFFVNITNPVNATIADGQGVVTITDNDINPHMNDPEHMALLDLVPLDQGTHVAVNNGSWFNPSTWRDGQIPSDNAKVIIPNGITVQYDDQSDSRLFTLGVYGELNFATDIDTKIIIDTFVVTPQGKLTIGTQSNPVASNVQTNIIIADNGAIDTTWDTQQLSRGLISHGEVTIHGQQKTSHLKVATNPLAGDTQIVLASTPTGWSVGDRIVLTGTRATGYSWNGSQKAYKGTQDEEKVITAISGNTITLDQPLVYDHDSPRGDLKAYVANYSRNIRIETENYQNIPSNQRGHTMFMHSDNVDVRYAEFFELGRTDKSVPLNTTDNITGRYSLHIHRTGVNSSNPVKVKGNSVWGSPGWGFVHHDSNAIFEENASYNSFGTGFMSESGNEIGAWRNNIAIKGQGNGGSVKSGVRTNDLAGQGTGFWLQSRLVEVENNVAAGMSSHGFIFFHRGASLPIPKENLSNPEISDYADYVGFNIPNIKKFKDNEAFGSDIGLEVVKANPRQGHDVRSLLEGFTAWSIETGAKFQYTSKYTVKDFDVVGIQDSVATGWQAGVKDGEIGLDTDSNTYDIIFINPNVENFNVGIDLSKQNVTNTPSTHEYIVVNPTYQNVGLQLDNYDPLEDKILTTADITNDPLSLELSPLTDLVFDTSTTDRQAVITGLKKDSLGVTPFMENLEQKILDNPEAINRIQQGYYTLSDGTRMITWEVIVADRLTNLTKKVSIPVILSDSNNSLTRNVPYLGDYDSSINIDQADTDFELTQNVSALNDKVIGTSGIDLFKIDLSESYNAVIHSFEDNKDALLIDQNAQLTFNSTSISISLNNNLVDLFIDGVTPTNLQDDIIFI